MPMHAERNIVLPILSVCLYVGPSNVSKRMPIVTLFSHSGKAIILVFYHPNAVIKFQAEPPQQEG